MKINQLLQLSTSSPEYKQLSRKHPVQVTGHTHALHSQTKGEIRALGHLGIYKL